MLLLAAEKCDPSVLNIKNLRFANKCSVWNCHNDIRHMRPTDCHNGCRGLSSSTAEREKVQILGAKLNLAHLPALMLQFGGEATSNLFFRNTGSSHSEICLLTASFAALVLPVRLTIRPKLSFYLRAVCSLFWLHKVLPNMRSPKTRSTAGGMKEPGWGLLL